MTSHVTHSKLDSAKIARIAPKPKIDFPKSIVAILGVQSGVAPANQTKERPGHELFPGANRNKSSM